MDRRMFLTRGTALAGLGVAAGPRAALAQDGVAPIAIASARSGGRMAVVRAYPARGAGALILMIRIGERDRYATIDLPASGWDRLRQILEAGAFTLRTGEISGRGEMRIDGVALRGRFSMADGSDVEVAGTGDPDTQGLFAAIAIIAAAAALVAIVAIMAASGGGRISVGNDTLGELTIEVGDGSGDGGDDRGGGDSFMADPACDGFPPLLC